MQDRQPGKPGQYKATLTAAEFQKMQAGQQFTITMIRDDQPIVEGTPYSKAAVLPDAVANAICPDIDNPTPADAFRALQNQKAPAGYGLGSVKDIKAEELNTTNQNGWYRIANSSMTVGGFTWNDWYVHVKRYSAKYLVQELYPVNKKYKLVRWCLNGVWEEEWENPPMQPDVEYATTERCGGKTVYRKRVVFTNSDTMGAQSGVGNFLFTHGISNFGELVRIDGKVGEYPLPYMSTSGGLTMITGISAASIALRTYNTSWTSREWQFDIAYTKTT